MFTGYLRYGGREIINAARTAAYAEALVPGLDLRCQVTPDFAYSLGHEPYTTPTADGAPWMGNPNGGDFCGLYPLAIDGLDNSTLETHTVEHAGRSGGAHLAARRRTREVRVRGVMIARTDRGMESGMEWLRHRLAGAKYLSEDENTDPRLEFFISQPPLDMEDGSGFYVPQNLTETPANSGLYAIPGLVEDPVGSGLYIPGALPEVGMLAEEAANSFWRECYDVEVLQGVRVVSEHATTSAVTRTVEFLLSAGVPGVFTRSFPVQTLTGVSASLVPEVECGSAPDGYDDFIVDPLGADVRRPPAPPNVTSPLTVAPASWRRYTAGIDGTALERDGRIVPWVRVGAPSTAARNIRIRFYDSTSGTPPACSYLGEYWITYIPAGGVLTIDAIRNEVTMRLGGGGGRVRDATHLVFGSGGKPLLWPDLLTAQNVMMVVDSTGNLNSNYVRLEIRAETA